MKKVRVGIIGAGSISPYHIAGYKALGNTELFAVCDINEERALKCAKTNNIPHVFTDYREMLKLAELDALSVCTPNNMHAPISIAALKAGKNVLCEKPMAINSQEAQAMEKAAMDSGKLLMIGFVRRFGNDAAILKDFIDAGDMGDIYYSKASYLRRNGCPGGWFSDSSISGGGPLIDLGVHVIDLVRYLMGCPKPVSVYGAAFSKLGRMENVKQSRGYVSSDQGDVYDVEDLAAAMIRFDNGAVLYVDTSFSLNIKEPVGIIDIFGTKSGARIDPGIEFYSRMNDYLVDIAPAGDTALSFTGLFESQVAHFIDCVYSGKECRSPAKDGVVLMEIIDGIYKSARLGREVRLPEGEEL